MFELLTERLGAIFQRLGSKGRLTEKDVDEALREVRLALLEADVHFKVVKDFIAKVREACVGAQFLESLSPGQQVIKAVHRELVVVLGGGQRSLTHAARPPTVAMLAGLQGSGKTTTAAKLALHLKRQGKRLLLVAADLRRPAAVEQLVILGKEIEIPVYSEGLSAGPVALSVSSLAKARELATDWVIVDTGGRLHIDEDLMVELGEMKKALSPTEVLLVVDAMTGQDAVRAAQEFHTRIGLTGLILTKMDGDARGGAALSITAVSGVPVKFIGTGERAEALEPFHPERMASRILGMGDVLTLIEKAEVAFDERKAKELERKVRTASMNLEDFLEQIQQVKKMGPLSQLLEMVPGLGGIGRQMPAGVDEKHFKRIEAIIRSMTLQERRNPEIIDGSRKKRIARGSGTTPQEINQLLNQFRQMQKVMKLMSSGRGISQLFR